ncbi:endonuclease NucS domain-containing protein [Tessaracoccus lacteus]|uniref:Endonuclease NucS n=1 Tax=Tessaracoccus lacteus TaxID=3041766 RepID=A0ABY8PYN2_9ACTN|nr:endonuclease NucS domain-containing protein [Tessaracoccus sp. T21]WGT47620.1 endonuclease NucS [Tessaracoccus sp. T21]
MTACYFIRLGRRGTFVQDAVERGYVGVDYGMVDDFKGKFPDEWTAFNKTYIPRYLDLHPDKTKVAAGLACGTIWTLGKGMKDGDLVVTPDPAGILHVGRVTGPYAFVPGEELPHRRPVSWQFGTINRDEMSAELRRSTDRYPATVSNISQHLAEIESLLQEYPQLVSTDPDVEDPVQFALEKYLEEFLVDNWTRTELGKRYDIYCDDEGNQIGRQYQSDTGPLDILAVSKDGAELLVVELKRGKASDSVVGQIQRYMGYIKDQVAEPTQAVRGVIIALEDDLRIQRALSVASGIEFYRYQVKFTLIKA